MAICDPSQNPSVPQGLSPWSGPVPAGVSSWIWPLANDTSIPIGSTYFRWFGNVPVAARVECHTYTVNPDGSQTPGRFHGVTIYRVTDMALMQQRTGAPEKTDWKMVGLAAGAIGLTVTAFFAALKLAERPRYAR